MARYYKRSRRYGRSKRATERSIKAGTASLPPKTGNDPTTYTAYFFTTDKPMTIRSISLDVGVSATSSTTLASTKAVYALVVVREGYDSNNLNWPAVETDLYNPTQDVLISGVLTGSNDDHKRNMIGRKMKTGDRLALLVANVSATASDVGFELSFTSVY